MIAGGRACRQSPRPGPRIRGDEFIAGDAFINGLKEENVGGLAGVVGDWARVEHVKRRLGALGPRPERLDRHLQIAPGHNALVYLCGVAPGKGEGPVGLALVADGLLQEAGLVGVRRLHEVARGLHPVHGGEYGVHRVEVVERHQWDLWVG